MGFAKEINKLLPFRAKGRSLKNNNDHIASGFDDPKYRSLSMERRQYNIGEQIGDIRERREFHRKHPETEPLEQSAPASKSTAISTPNQKTSIDSLMFRKAANMSKGEVYLYDKTNKQFTADLNAMSNPLAKKEIGETYGIKNHEGLSDTQFGNALRNYHERKIKAGPKFADHMMGHKVPQKAVGLMVTAGVVNALCGSKGQQTNAQLYGQAPMSGIQQ